MDLTKPGNYPRSGREMLGGVAFLPRTIDKMRAHLNGTAGEYNALTGLSSRVYDLFGITAQDFARICSHHPDEEGVLRALRHHATKSPTPQDIEQHNKAILEAGPRTDEAKARLRANLEKIGHGDRTDVTTYLDSEDLEEGREVPRRG